MPTPSQCFTQTIKQLGGNIHPAQQQALAHFDQLHHYLEQQQNKGFIGNILNKIGAQRPCNIYCWGKVGQGKTAMMDTFCQSLPQDWVMRVHFHAFMLDIHARLKDIKHVNPVELIAQELKQHCSVLCLDEFIVDNIVDAMLLGKLLTALAQQEISVVTTGNTAPERLYQHGLRRDQFQATITLIQTTFTVIHLQTGQDYRQQHQSLDLFHLGDSQTGDEFIMQHWQQHFNTPIKAGTLTVFDREISILAECEQAIWLDFHMLCSPPRAAKDYLYLCQHYPWIFISHVDRLQQHASDLIYNWIKFIDICYDQQIQLVIASNVALSDIYTGTDRQLDNLIHQERCLSRLETLLQSKSA